MKALGLLLFLPTLAWAQPVPIRGPGDGATLDGDGAGEADVIDSAPAGTEQGLVTRPIPSGTQTVAGTVAVMER